MWFCLSFELQKDTFEEHEYKMHCSTISSIVLRFEDFFHLSGHWKYRSRIFQHRTRWKGASELDLELMRHRTTILGIVVRFVCDLIFSYKSQTHFWGKEENFGERNWLLEQEIWREGGRPSKLISGYQFHVMNPSFILVICVLATSS